MRATERHNLMKYRLLVVLLSVAGFGTSLFPAAPGYSLLRKVNVGGTGAWDYLIYDTTGHRVFVSRGNHVMVLDGESGATVGDIPDTPGVHGIALAPEFAKGFTSNGQSSDVTIFDLNALKPIGRVATGKGPDAIVYDPSSKRVFTMNGRDNTATAIDAASGQPVGTIPLSGRPEFAVADGKGTIFVNIEDKHTLTALDARKLTVKSNWDMPGCERPTGLSMDLENRRLFSGCDKLLAILDADSGKLVATVPIGAGVDATAFDPKTALAFSSNGGDGTLTVVHEDSPDKFALIANVPTEAGARTMALNPDDGTVYLVTATVGPKLILSFILGILRPVIRPAVGGLAAVCLLLSLLFLMRARPRGWPTKLRWWFGVFVVAGVLLALWCWNYDALLTALSPNDFHVSMWR
jgi:DNA-binding beta-propeller fold protein YncE